MWEGLGGGRDGGEGGWDGVLVRRDLGSDGEFHGVLMWEGI